LHLTCTSPIHPPLGDLHIRADCWTRKKKQAAANVTKLAGGVEEQCDILSITDRLVGNKG